MSLATLVPALLAENSAPCTKAMASAKSKYESAGKPGRSVAESSPLELIDSRISGKTIAGTTIAGWRRVRTTERRASMPTWR